MELQYGQALKLISQALDAHFVGSKKDHALLEACLLKLDELVNPKPVVEQADK